MKRPAILVAILLLAACAGPAQTALYKRYAKRADLKAYCIENYPLNEKDSVTVTVFQTDDTSTYLFMQRELGIKAKMKKEGRKHVVIHLTKSMEGDRGDYIVCLPSDRMSLLVFHVEEEKDLVAVYRNILTSEFDTHANSKKRKNSQ